MEIPSIWLWLSGIFFLVNIIFFGVLIFALMKILQLSKELKPKVDRISDRLDSISEKVDSIATDLKQTVRNVGEKTTNVASSAEIISTLGAANFGKYAPILAALGTAVKGAQMLKQLGIGLPKRKRK
jgi:hypothetical protein